MIVARLNGQKLQLLAGDRLKEATVLLDNGDTLGPRDAYRELAAVTHDIPADARRLLRIELISPKAPTYEALRSVFGRTASVEGERLGNTMVGGTFIDGAYLYEVR